MKHLNIKKIYGIMLMVLALAVLAGCTAAPTPSTETTAQPTAQSTEEVTALPVETAAAQAADDTDALPIFTAEELAKYNGQNGNPAYVAINGKVYDVSSIPQWSGGSHYQGLKAGADLSEAIKNAPHSTTVLEKLPVVGLYE